MSKITNKHLFTSESVSEGHPDKVSDQISDGILDACLAQDPKSRVACETLVTTNLVVVSGEITTKATVDYEKVIREVIKNIGYNDDTIRFAADTCEVMVKLHSQSPDISQGVTEGNGLFNEQGAGDQGMMFGYASNETENYMPLTIDLAHALVEKAAKLRKDGTLPFLYPDGKAQVTVEYDKGKPVAVKTVVMSHQHKADIDYETLKKEIIEKVIDPIIPAELRAPDMKIYVNPTGKFVVGGPDGDTGLTGRKIIVDTYGGIGSHGGGAFSGKDPSKVDRSAAYAARYIAKNIVAAELADKCEVQLAYAIGVAEPISVNVDTYGTAKIDENKIYDLIKKYFPLKPKDIIEQLGLLNPIYLQTASYGHFGKDGLPWEKTDKAELLSKEVKELASV